MATDCQAVHWLGRLVTGVEFCGGQSGTVAGSLRVLRFSTNAPITVFVLKSTLNWIIGRSLGHHATKVMLIGKSANVKKSVFFFKFTPAMLVLELWIVLMHIKAL